MNLQTRTSDITWRDFSDRDAHQDRLAAELMADTGDW
jgi:hypothetical protein